MCDMNFHFFIIHLASANSFEYLLSAVCCYCFYRYRASNISHLYLSLLMLFFFDFSVLFAQRFLYQSFFHLFSFFRHSESCSSSESAPIYSDPGNCPIPSFVCRSSYAKSPPAEKQQHHAFSHSAACRYIQSRQPLSSVKRSKDSFCYGRSLGKYFFSALLIF